ncbi:hypothetical protein J6590_006325 [Homalodisca vitripennis]|nr:hypothetical protein J6590_006325 [Homalodisca vitripennis]
MGVTRHTPPFSDDFGRPIFSFCGMFVEGWGLPAALPHYCQCQTSGHGLLSDLLADKQLHP